MEIFDDNGYSPYIKGLYYEDDFITEEEEKQLLADIYAAEWKNVLNRRVQHYGYSYDYVLKKIEYVGELPEFLTAINKKVSSYLLDEGQLFNQVIINEYVPGQGIGAHTDLLQLGSIVVCISLGSTVLMNFSRSPHLHSVQLNRRSLVVMEDDARYYWKHSIPARTWDLLVQSDGTEKKTKRETRVSITFRLVPSK